MKILATLLILFTTHSYAANVCDDANFLKKSWDSRYSQIVQVTNQRPSPITSEVAIAMVSRAFCLLENTGIPNFFDFFAYFTKYVTSASLEPWIDNGIFARANDNRSVEIYKIFFRSGSLWDYKRAAILLHEARHIELNQRNGFGPQHVVCNHGESAGKEGCDEVFSNDWATASPFSYEVMFFRNLVEKSTNEFNRRDLKIWVNYLLENMFNEVPEELRLTYSYPEVKNRRNSVATISP